MKRFLATAAAAVIFIMLLLPPPKSPLSKNRETGERPGVTSSQDR